MVKLSSTSVMQFTQHTTRKSKLNWIRPNFLWLLFWDFIKGLYIFLVEFLYPVLV